MTLPLISTTKQLDMQCNDPFLKEAVEKLGLPAGTKEFTVRIIGESRAVELEVKHVDFEAIKASPKFFTGPKP